jgi:hypothetical protein
MQVSRFSCGIAFVLVCLGSPARAQPDAKLRLFEWERGVGFASPLDRDMRVYLWFYEWNMFEARRAGQHTPGTYQLPRRVAADGSSAEIGMEDLKLSVRAAADSAELTLSIENRSDHDWPEPAGIIPCFNPGPEEVRNRQLANTNTYFAGRDGLEKLIRREIHFSNRIRPLLDRMAPDGQFVFSHKWPTAEKNAAAGVIVRESTDGRWVTGIAWDDFLSAQGHNPWECMHLCARVGPLKRGERKSIRGKIYLFQGDKEALYARYRRDFAPH